MSALGICVGIAAIVGVLGVSHSSRAGLLAQLGRLGNLLVVEPGQSLTGTGDLPASATVMIKRIGPVTSASATGKLPGTAVYRNAHIPSFEGGGIEVQAADVDLPRTVGALLAAGQFLNPATARLPCVVLGAAAAKVLGIDATQPLPQIWLGDQPFTVVGILAPVPLSQELDSSALVGMPVAAAQLGFDGHPSRIYVRSEADQVAQVRAVLAATANPAEPVAVAVSRPSEVLAARSAADASYTGLFLALGSISLVVGAIGIANVMVISVLERRSEIGLRRALGATRTHIAGQFLTESVLLAGAGGVMGAIVGAVATTVYATAQHWAVVVPAFAVFSGLAAAVAVGALGGLYPALRAARLTPTEALRSS